ncbi:MAG: glycosyl transferase [Patescibacteria group bacterium]|nr:MAG: glycosyl transferase [Patescibacteria group bacterium]
MQQKAIVIIPTYNEKENIQTVVPLLFEQFEKVKGWDMGILVVDDTSPDKTYDAVKQLQKKYKRLHLLINPQKAGLGGAYLKGMDEAFNKLRAEVVLQFDADLSHDPKKIPEFMKAIDEGADMVVGSRYIPGGGIPDNWGIHRKFMSVVGNLVAQLLLTNFSIKDWTGGFRALRKKVYQAVVHKITDKEILGYTFQVGFLNAVYRSRFKIIEIPFKFVDRTIGESKLPLSYMQDTLLYLFRLRWNDLVTSRVFKFLVVGGVGTLIQLTSLQIFRSVLPDFQLAFLSKFILATFLSIEIAIASNFLLNNSWTFADKKLDKSKMLGKFLQFNLTSSGSIIIQLIVNFLGERFIGLFDLFVVPIIGMVVDTGLVFAATGIIIGLFWNFFAYNKFIWKTK